MGAGDIPRREVIQKSLALLEGLRAQAKDVPGVMPAMGRVYLKFEEGVRANPDVNLQGALKSLTTAERDLVYLLGMEALLRELLEWDARNNPERN